MKQQDNELHAKGQARFADDIPLTKDILHVFPLLSNIAHGLIKSVDFSKALSLPGVKTV